MINLTLKMKEKAREHYGGQRGEHRMCCLAIPLPKERLSEIQSCIAVFSCDEQLVLSPLILPGDEGDCYISGGKVYVALWQRLTQCRVLRVQLECYGDTGGSQFIDRTAISEPILFGDSLSDSLDHIAEAPAEPGVIEQLLNAMHTHGNKTILDELGELAGQLTYKGEPVRTPPLTNLQLEALIQQAMNNS
jgi:hypothetical protein